MKKIIRINITNKCNLECSFCCVFGSPANNTFMDFDTFKDIIDKYKSLPIVVKLEGGEPLLHNRLYLFIEYLSSLENVKKIVIQTNGVILDQHIDRIIEFSNRLEKPIEVKIGINDETIKNENLLKYASSVIVKSQHSPFVRISFAVRYSSEENLKQLLEILDHYSIPRILCDVDVLNSYGRLENTDYPKPCVPYKFLYECYASDGKYFNDDLELRSKHEQLLINSSHLEYPAFDLTNHHQMWKETISVIDDINFENKYDVRLWSFEFQHQYILNHLNNFTAHMIQEHTHNYAKYYAKRIAHHNYCQYDPFEYEVGYVDCCAENLIREFRMKEQNMKRTTCREVFYANKLAAIELAKKISKLKVKESVLKV